MKAVESLKELRRSVGLPVSQQVSCPSIGSGSDSFFCDVDCDNHDAVYPFNMLRSAAGLSVSQTELCPDLGSTLETAVIAASTAESSSPLTKAVPIAPAAGVALLGLGGLWGISGRLRKP